MRVASAQSPIVVIVHAKSPLTEISLESLQRLYLGSSRSFPNGQPAVLVESAPLRDRFYSEALGMNADRFKRHWIRVVFSGEGASPPKYFGEPGDVLQYVATHPGAIAFVELSTVNGSVKVLSLDGLRPADAHYRLR